MKLTWNCGALAEGLQCYRDEQFFLAHEHWESVWLKCEEPEKTFLQALIQMTSAFHHFRRDNYRGATSLLTSALRRLEPYAETFEGVEVASLRQEIRTWLQALEVHNSPNHLLFPEIHLI
jgi:hypothetical protein